MTKKTISEPSPLKKLQHNTSKMSSFGLLFWSTKNKCRTVTHFVQNMIWSKIFLSKTKRFLFSVCVICQKYFPKHFKFVPTIFVCVILSFFVSEQIACFYFVMKWCNCGGADFSRYGDSFSLLSFLFALTLIASILLRSCFVKSEAVFRIITL